MLSALLGMREGSFSLEDPVAVEELADRLTRRSLGVHLKQISGYFPKSADQASFVTRLEGGRVARNWLAHQAALRVLRFGSTEDERQRFLFALQDQVYALWEADFSVAYMINVVSGDADDTERGHFGPIAVSDWVYERFPYRSATPKGDA